jgi:hypothetical protein
MTTKAKRKPKTLKPENEKVKRLVVYLPGWLYDDLERIAKARGRGFTSMAKEWLGVAAQQERARGR